jgi:GTPase SAR1 family protein
MNLWDWLVVKFSGSTIGILGQRAAGKTTLHAVFRDAPMPDGYRPTVAAQSVGTGRQLFQALPGSDHQPQSGKVAVRKGRDVPGDSKLNAASWKDVILESDVVLYLFDVHKLLASDAEYAERFKFDCELIEEFLGSRTGPEPKFALVGTHCDLEPTYRPPNSGSPFFRFWNKVNTLEVVQYGVIRLGQALENEPRVVLGSMKTLDSAADLAFRICKQELGL